MLFDGGKNTVQAKAWLDKRYPNSGNSMESNRGTVIKRGSTNTNDAERFDYPVEMVRPKKLRKFHKLVLANRKVKLSIKRT